ncbi:MAG: tetratricopeptide repeat protein [Deltaproteobacteria bacterium]|nr:tetratricopeptide repeat protein [Deltaproteobacteria bacterium]
MYSFRNIFLDKIEKHPLRLNLSVLAILLCLIIAGYSNTFNAAWHLDDYQNIVDNSRLHLRDLRPESIIKTFFASRDNGLYEGRKIYRPVACLTFGLNWFFGQNNVIGYHLVNILIHISTAFILFHTITGLLNTPHLKNKYKGSAFFIALLSSVLWAVNPIQTQAVTYIVQRMASLAAMFYILGIFFYVKGRCDSNNIHRYLLFAGCFVSFLLALGSKQNTATLPLALLLIEFIFFQKIENRKAKRILLCSAACAALLVLLLGWQLFMKGDLLWFLHGYSYRPYSVAERLLTEFRILIYYLSQIFYPMPQRLSIEHDIIISTSPFTPWITLPSIIIVLSLIGFALLQLKKRPLICFAVLFFFLNHIIESSVIPLELIYEHRNYLPSMFIFLPIAAGFKQLIDYYQERQPSMHRIVSAFVVLIIISFCSCTYLRNAVWATEKTLWEDAMLKAPGHARPIQNLAWSYYERIGNLDKALELHKKSLAYNDAGTPYPHALTFYNIGVIYYYKQEYEKAINYLKKALEVYPGYEKSRYNIVLSFIAIGRWDEAITNIDLLVTKRADHRDYQNLKGFILLKRGRINESLPYFQRALMLEPNLKSAIVNIGVNLSLLGRYKLSEQALTHAGLIAPDDITILFCLLENSVRARETEKTDIYLENLFNRFNIKDIRSILEQITEQNLTVPIASGIVVPVIENRWKQLHTLRRDECKSYK